MSGPKSTRLVVYQGYESSCNQAIDQSSRSGKLNSKKIPISIQDLQIEEIENMPKFGRTGLVPMRAFLFPGPRGMMVFTLYN